MPVSSCIGRDLGRRGQSGFHTWKRDSDQRAPAAAGDLRRVQKIDAATVVFDDLCDDRKAESGTFFAGREVGLEQALPILLRQPDAVVDNLDDDEIALGSSIHRNTALPSL